MIKQTHNQLKLAFLCLIPLLALQAGGVFSQNLIFTNPADIDEPRSNFANPALISYQGSQIVMGMKAYHVGFLDNNAFGFKSGFLSVASPYLVSGKLGLGMNAQYFNTPLYRQTNVSLAASRKFLGVFALGIRMNVFSKSYNQSEFDLVDENDPVFSGGTTKYAVSFGTGVMIVPVPNLYLAAGIEHMNRPNIALSSVPFRQPMELTFGLKYSFSAISSSFYMKSIESNMHPFFEIERNFWENWKARLGYGMKNVFLSGLVHVGYGLSLSYEYEYPFSNLKDTSLGSYSLCVNYNIDKIPRLPREIKRPCQRVIFKMPKNGMKLQPRFVVYSSVNALEIFEKQITRAFDDSLNKAEISSLTNFEIGVLDSTKINSPLYFKTHPLDAYYPDVDRAGHFTNLYNTALDTVIRQLSENKNLEMQIISTKGVTNRAAGLQNYFLKSSGIKGNQVRVAAPIYRDKSDSLMKNQKISRGAIQPRESISVISDKTTTFYLVPIYMERYNNNWALSIHNSSGKIIKEFSGLGKIPEQIRWDWKDTKGQFIQPDLYYYSIKWIDDTGQAQVSNPRIIDVQKIKRNLKITITKKKNFNKEHIKKYGLKLNR